MAQQGQQGGEESDEMVGLIILFAVIVAAGYGAWHFFSPQIVRIVFALKAAEIDVIHAILGEGQRAQGGRVTLGYLDKFMAERHPATISFNELKYVTSAVGEYVRWGSAGLIAIIGGITVWKMPSGSFRRTFKLGPNRDKGFQPPWKTKKPSFMEYQAQHWKVTQPAIHMIDPENPDKNNMPQHTPLEWLKSIDAWFYHADGGFEGNQVAWNKAIEELRRQLGKPWPGIHKVPTYVRALVVLFLVHGMDHKEKDTLKDEIALIWSTTATFDKANRAIEERIKPFLEPDENSKKRSGKRVKLKMEEAQNLIDHMTREHHFISTVLLGMFWWAKRTGAFPSSDVRWLKSIDRDLWFALNNLGRYDNGHIDGAGPIAHFNAERVMGHRLIEPQVDEAVHGINQYLKEQGVTDLAEFFRQQNYNILYDPVEDDEETARRKQEQVNSVDMGLKETREYIEANEELVDAQIAASGTGSGKKR